MAFIVDLEPIEIKKLKKRLEKQRNREAKERAISKETEKGIQENPIKRNQFSID